MSLWKVEAENAQGAWQIMVRCDDPFEAMRLAAAKNSWSVLDGIKVTGVIDFIDAGPAAGPSQTEREEG